MTARLPLLRFGRGPQAERPKESPVLRALLERRAGMTADDLAAQLSISRSATHQQLARLQRDGLVERRGLALSGGRPGQIFVITEKGIEGFPKRYDWFSTLLFSILSRRLDRADIEAELEALGRGIGAELRAASGGAVSVEQAAKSLSDLGYHARPGASGDDIEAFNCVFHHLAQEHPAVCSFDLALLEAAVGARPEHASCMARGDGLCRFRFAPQARAKL